RVVGIESDVGGAGLRILEQHLLPGLTAIRRPINAPFRIGTKRMAQHGREGDVRIVGVYGHRANLAFLLPDMSPRLAGIGGFVNAVAGRDVASWVGLTGTDVDHI